MPVVAEVLVFGGEVEVWSFCADFVDGLRFWFPAFGEGVILFRFGGCVWAGATIRFCGGGLYYRTFRFCGRVGSGQCDTVL